MKELSANQLKKLLNTSHIRGTPDQISVLAIRVGELDALNGRTWIMENAAQLLAQWDMVLDSQINNSRCNMASDVKAHVIIKGRVQGVFFRVETQRAAERIGVRGWVRNNPDGNVEAVFEGPDQLVNQAVDWCWKGSPMSHVTDVQVEWEEPTQEFHSFSIEH